MNLVLRWWRGYQAEKARQQRIGRMFQLLRESDDDLQRIGRELTTLYANTPQEGGAAHLPPPTRPNPFGNPRLRELREGGEG